MATLGFVLYCLSFWSLCGPMYKGNHLRYMCVSLSFSLLPAIMQHRRTVSDTLLFRRPSVLEELKKDGPSSSHSSRSATPLLALLQPSGEGGVVGQTMVGQTAGSKVAGVVTSQHSPQQQKIAQREVQTIYM